MDVEPLQHRLFDFQKGAVLLINKPQNWTSFDVVNKIRYKLKYKLGVKKIKVGHAGTLDPMATGLLIICTGKFTKRLSQFQGLPKIYTGTMQLGATTPSFDTETEIDGIFPTDHITSELLEKIRQQFIGDTQQYPPMFSAIKVDGQPLYKKARRGEKVEVKPRPVYFYHFNFTNIKMPLIDFEVKCSKGTYIRSLAYDFGKACESGAHLTKLCRTHIGEHELKNAWELTKFIDYVEENY